MCFVTNIDIDSIIRNFNFICVSIDAIHIHVAISILVNDEHIMRKTRTRIISMTGGLNFSFMNKCTIIGHFPSKSFLPHIFDSNL